MASKFDELGLQPQFIQAIAEMGFDQPTPIQAATIPALLEGRNVIGQAQTGTGKTAAFVCPCFKTCEPGEKTPQALILAPTRELAIQVTEALSKMAVNSAVVLMTVYGGQSYSVQMRADRTRRGCRCRHPRPFAGPTQEKIPGSHPGPLRGPGRSG